MANKGLGRGLGSLLGILDDEEEVLENKETEIKEEVKKKMLLFGCAGKYWI